MRIGIDARFFTHPQAGGFRTYTRSLLGALAEADQDNDYLLYVDRAPETPQPLADNFRLVPVPERMPLLGMVWREQVSLPQQMARDRLDVFHALCLTAPLRLPCPLVVTIHDMIWHRPVRLNSAKPSLKHLMLDAYYHHVPARAARRSSSVLTVSQAARDSILRELNLPPGQVRVAYEAAAARFRPHVDADAQAALCARFGVTPGFIMAMGSADPRKNVSGLLRAYAALPDILRARHPLAVVWTHRHLADGLAAEAQALGIAADLHFLQGVTDDELVLLYNLATLFVFPSRYEGFGLPLLEAMACGTPVITADNSSLPEIAGDAGLLVGADDLPALAQAITRALTDEELRARMREQGLRRAQEFSWTRCAQETLAVYREAACGV